MRTSLVLALVLLGCGGEVEALGPRDDGEVLPASDTDEPLAALPRTDLARAWLVDVDPARPLGASQGEIPRGVPGKAGRVNRAMGSVELVPDGSPRVFDFNRDQDELTANAVRWGKTVELGAHDWPTAWPPRYSANNRFEALSRVRDPDDTSGWAYLHRISKRDVAWYNHVDPHPGNASAAHPPRGTTAPDSFRSEVGSTGSDRFEPWGTEEWVVGAVRIPAYFRSLPSSGRDWMVVFQLHDAEGGLSGNPPFACYYSGGGDDPANSRLSCSLRRYRFSQADYEDEPTRKGNRVVASVQLDDPKPDTWHYLIAHYRYGNGYVDPELGHIYGPTGEANADKVFFELYHAIDNNGPRPVLAYTGYWGSPGDLTNSERAEQAGFWKTGLYLQSTWSLPGHDERALWTKGLRQYRARDIPGAKARDVLGDFLQR